MQRDIDLKLFVELFKCFPRWLLLGYIKFIAIEMLDLCNSFDFTIDRAFKFRTMSAEAILTRFICIKPYGCSPCLSACSLVPTWNNVRLAIPEDVQKSIGSQRTYRSADYNSTPRSPCTCSICRCADSPCLSPLSLMILYLISLNRAIENLTTHILHSIPKTRSH